MSEMSPGLARRGFAAETGFTVLELIITVALLGVVMAVVGAGMISLTDTTRSTDERSRADTELRNAVERLARDIRAANPIDVIDITNPATPSVAVYDRRISFETYCTPVGGTCDADNLRQRVYRVTANRLEVSTGGGAFRQILGPSLTSSLPITQRQFAIVNSSTEPVFTYLRDDGTAIPTGGGSPAPPERFRDCTQAVRVHIRMISEPGNTRAPADLTTTVTLRNFNEVSNCAIAATTTTV